MSTAPHQYQKVAEWIASLVERGTLAPGSRAPSLREASRSQRVALSTALQAYRVLEDRGILEARPRSGHFVARAAVAPLGVPSVSRAAVKPTDVEISGKVVQLLAHAADPALIPLGCAIPGTKVLAPGRLERYLARALRMDGPEHNVYTGPQGDPRLRQEIARRSARLGHSVGPQDIVITAGCTEAIALALGAVCRPGDAVIIESPSYFGLLHALEALRLKAVELPADAGNGIDVAQLERVLCSQPVHACLLAANFSNPLGYAMSEAKKREILAVLARYKVPLIEDDIYGDLHFGDERPRPFSAFDREGMTLYCSSFSKTIAPGWRLGWLVPGRHMQSVLDRKFAATLCGAALPQSAFADFLSAGGYDNHLRRLRGLFRAGVDRMTECVAASFPHGTRVSRPAGGFVLWVELPRRLNARVLLEEALRRGVCFAPGDVFSARGRYAHCLRLSCGEGWDARLESGVRTIGELACLGSALDAP